MRKLKSLNLWVLLLALFVAVSTQAISQDVSQLAERRAAAVDSEPTPLSIEARLLEAERRAEIAERAIDDFLAGRRAAGTTSFTPAVRPVDARPVEELIPALVIAVEKDSFNLDDLVTTYDNDDDNIGRFGRDQKPDLTAKDISDLFKNAIITAKDLAGDEKTLSVDDIKQLTDSISAELKIVYANHKGAEKDWDNFFKGLMSKLNDSRDFNAGALSHWVIALGELSDGFESVRVKRKGGRNITPEIAARNAGISSNYGSGGSGYYGSGLGSGYISPTWAGIRHAKRMKRIEHKYTRRAVKIQAIVGQ